MRRNPAVIIIHPMNTMEPTADEGEASAVQQVSLDPRQLGGQAGGQREVLRLLRQGVVIRRVSTRQCKTCTRDGSVRMSLPAGMMCLLTWSTASTTSATARQYLHQCSLPLGEARCACSADLDGREVGTRGLKGSHRCLDRRHVPRAQCHHRLVHAVGPVLGAPGGRVQHNGLGSHDALGAGDAARKVAGGGRLVECRPIRSSGAAWDAGQVRTAAQRQPPPVSQLSCNQQWLRGRHAFN